MAYGIHIDLNAGNDGRGVMLYTLAHELTHHIRKNSPEKFKAFADVVMKGYGDRGISAENLIQEQIAKAKRNGRDISYDEAYDEAYEEMIADSMEGILADGKVLEKLKGLQESDPGLWETVKQWAKDIAEKIRAVVDAYKGERMDSTEGRIVANMKEILPQLEELYAEGLADTRSTTVTYGDAGAKNAAQDGGVVKMQTRDVDGNQVVWIENSGFTNKQLKDPNVIAQYIASHIGDVYRIIESGQKVYIGRELPSEYTHSKYTSFLQKKNPSTLKAKNRAVSGIGEMIEIATNRRWEETKHKDSKDAKFGIYRYDTKFAFPIFDQDGNTTSVKAYDAELLIRNASNGKKYLYDIVNIKENTANALDLRHKEARKDRYKSVTQSSASGYNLTQPETDVKRKLSDRDSSGTQLSKEQADYFRNSKVRDEKGNLLVMYHGTPNGGFTKFRSGSYFTQNPDYAALYQNPGASMLGYKKGADNPQNYQVYLNIEKPFDTRNPKERRIFMQEYYRKYGTGAPLSDSGLPDWTDGMDLQEFIEDMGYDYDGLILDEGATGGYGEEVKSRGLSYVTFNPEQVKNVDNTTPTTDPDIRYSDRDPDAGKMNRILQKQNAELKDTVDYLRELVRLQGKVTDGTVYTWGSVEAAARRLMNGAGAKGDVVELRKILERTYKAMGEGSENMTGLIDEAAQWLVDHKPEAKPKLDSYAQTILSEIKGRGISLNDSQKAEAANLVGKYDYYRRRFFGTLNISDSANTSLDQFWQEMSGQYPDIFKPDISSSDMPIELYSAAVPEGLRRMNSSSFILTTASL